jgi:hypothetical protein
MLRKKKLIITISQKNTYKKRTKQVDRIAKKKIDKEFDCWKKKKNTYEK